MATWGFDDRKATGSCAISSPSRGISAIGLAILKETRNNALSTWLNIHLQHIIALDCLKRGHDIFCAPCGQPLRMSKTNNAYEVPPFMNTDIGGLGVRISFYMQTIFLGQRN